MALPHDHAGAALEHLISALRDEGITIRNYYRGYGAAAGIEYTRRGDTDAATFDPHNDGLELADGIGERVAGLIRAHCALYCALYPRHGSGHVGYEPTADELDANAPQPPCMDDTAAARGGVPRAFLPDRNS